MFVLVGVFPFVSYLNWMYTKLFLKKRKVLNISKNIGLMVVWCIFNGSVCNCFYCRHFYLVSNGTYFSTGSCPLYDLLTSWCRMILTCSMPHLNSDTMGDKVSFSPGQSMRLWKNIVLLTDTITQIVLHNISYYDKSCVNKFCICMNKLYF